jgi:AraC family transcriptional regulator of adaptative response/methylated-DNA-[protein]-cysteine methyltransferase
MHRGHKHQAARVLADPRWTAVVTRDAASDGSFFYSVRSTGIYCRPGCAARLPKPEHVAFHASAADAEREGFRPCRRCKPDQPAAARAKRSQLIAELCRYIEAQAHKPSLGELALRAGMSPFHLHRVFKAATGITPRAYAAAKRAQRLRRSLADSSTVTEAIYEAGFASSSRFYEATASAIGMTPSRYRNGGAGSVIRFATGVCSLGCVLVAQSERGICAVLLGDEPSVLGRDLRARYPKARLEPGDADFAQVLTAVVRLIDEPSQGLQLPLDIRGTAFQQRVWAALRALPVGARISYGELARRIGEPRAVRAVARACGANPLAVAVPCHRAVDARGGLAGYRWGLERKRSLLERERALQRSAGNEQGAPARRDCHAGSETQARISPPPSRRPARR